MPVFRESTVLHIARDIKAFLSVEVGLTRGVTPGTPPPDGGREAALKKELASKDAELEQLRRGASGGVRAEDIVWIFSTGRSGSTWLSNMMGDVSGYEVWKEPKVGQLFGDFYYLHNVEKQRRAKKFILGAGREDIWLRSIRSMVLDGAGARFPGAARDGRLVIKEPGGATGAPLLMRALPESRMVLLVRDPRDVISSVLDGVKKGGWIYNWREEGDKERDRLADEDPLAFVTEQAKNYRQQIGNAREAYENHSGPKALIRYEDLLAEPLGEMARMYSDLGLEVDGSELSRVVEEHAWAKMPEEQKGGGKFYRKGASGGWREDLTPEQADVISHETAPLLEAFYT